MPEFTQDDMNVRLRVRMSGLVTVGMHAGPLSRELVAEAVADYLGRVIEGGSVDGLIDAIDVDGMSLDDGTVLFEREG